MREKRGEMEAVIWVRRPRKVESYNMWKASGYRGTFLFWIVINGHIYRAGKGGLEC